jgi:HK97 family phage major capsid protein
MIDLKKFYDAAVAASTAKTEKAMEINKLFDAGETEKALAMKKELDDLTQKAKDAEELYLSMRDAAQGEDPAKRFVPADDRQKAEEIADADILKSKEYTRAFFKALAEGVTPGQFKKKGTPEEFQILQKALTENGGTPAGSDGGFLLPIDFNNMIIERQRQLLDLMNYVNVENVSAVSGWRVIEKSSDITPFAQMTENKAMSQTDQPSFEKISYTVKDYGGFLPVTNDLLEDTPVNIMAYLSRFFGKKLVATHNSLILSILNSVTEETVDTTNGKNGLDAIKKALNVTLDPDISVNASIFVNQDGYNFLDQLKDGQNRPLMQPDPTNATARRIYGRPVVLLSNNLWPSTQGTESTPKTHSRIVIGDTRELITMFARKGLEMATTAIGGDAWRNNNTEIRCVTRLDCVQVDDGAVTAIDCVVD